MSQTQDILASLKAEQRQGPVDPYGKFTLGEFLEADIEEPDPIIDGVFPQGSLVMLAGQHKVGKTLMMSQLAISVVTGRKWIGFDTNPVSVLYLNYEVAAWSFKKRLVKQLHGFEKVYGAFSKEQKASLNNNLIVESLPSLRLNKKSDIVDLAKYAHNRKVGLVVIDPIRGAVQGDRNKDELIDRIMQDLLDQVVKQSGAAVLMGHHIRKPPPGEQSTGSTFEMKGAGSFADSPDAIITMRRDNPEDRRAVTMGFTCRHYDSPDDITVSLRPSSLVFS